MYRCWSFEKVGGGGYYVGSTCLRLKSWKVLPLGSFRGLVVPRAILRYTACAQQRRIYQIACDLFAVDTGSCSRQSYYYCYSIYRATAVYFILVCLILFRGVYICRAGWGFFSWVRAEKTMRCSRCVRRGFPARARHYCCSVAGIGWQLWYRVAEAFCLVAFFGLLPWAWNLSILLRSMRINTTGKY